MTEILKIIPTMQSLALVEHNLSYLKKKKKKKIIRQGVDNLVGIAMIKETSSFLS